MIEILPDELKAEILKRVPNKELLRCTVVCKSWYSLIKSPSFIFNTHLPHIQASDSKPNLVIMCHYFDPNNYVISFHDDDTEELSECHLPPHFYSMFNLRPYASCNGLLLFRESSEYLLWNPSICRSLSLPKPKLNRPKGCELSSLGFDSTTNDFKVLRVLSDFDFEKSRPIVEAEIYSLNAASWKNLSHITPQYYIIPQVFLKRQCMPFVNGAFHMIAFDSSSDDKGQNLVLVFNVKDESFREILLPQCLQNTRLDMLFVIAYGQSIAVVHIYETAMKNDIWVMKEYGVYNSWTNLGKLQNEENASVAMFLRKNGQFMIDSGLGKFFSFDFATQSFIDLFPDLEDIEYTGDFWSASVFTYMETLALLDIV
ncbi:F-box protein At3g07870-like isoform X2 [Mercurialis annua]|uniref:F-box protein At3g07870-like isoform X2 n=1 Tax=Mercurialis annua TaxID=3986 RepID=UPI00215FE409|nr:F-box protein At3g07870-like isoform X2 [Mercurialis annua]